MQCAADRAAVFQSSSDRCGDRLVEQDAPRQQPAVVCSPAALQLASQRPQSKRGGRYAEIWLVDACCRSRVCRAYGNRRSCARRPHCAIGTKSDRRSASPCTNGNRPVQVARSSLLLVQQRMAGARLVPLWLRFKARRWLGWSGWLARLATSGPSPANRSSAAPPGATDRASTSSSTSAASRPSTAAGSAGTPSATPGGAVIGAEN